MIERKERKPYWRHTKWQMLASLVPFSACALFLYSARTEQLHCSFASGTDASGKLFVPALPALLTLIPLATLCGLLWFLTKLECEGVAEQAQVEHVVGWVQREPAQEALTAS